MWTWLWACSSGDIAISKLYSPPAAAITAPAAGEVGREVELVGVVVDWDGLDDIVELVWRSDHDGVLATIEQAPPDRDGITRFTTSLTPGKHMLTLEATDSRDMLGRAQVAVVVDGCAPPEGLRMLGLETRIYVDAAVDPQGVWLAWSQPDEQGLFGVWLQHLDCGGHVDVGPMQLDEAGANESEPAVAVNRGRVLVAWQADDGALENNLSVRWRLLEDGVLGPVQQDPLPYNALTPEVAATPTGWRLAAVHALEVFTLALDPLGVPVGEPENVPSEPGARAPDLAVDAAGGVHLAWEVDGQVFVARDGPAEALGSGHSPSISAGADGVWIGWSDDAGDLWTSRDGAALVRLRGGDLVQHSLTLAATGDGGLATWMVDEGGSGHRLVVGRYDTYGAILEQRDLGTASPQYDLALAPLDSNRSFVGWSSSERRAWGEYVRW